MLISCYTPIVGFNLGIFCFLVELKYTGGIFYLPSKSFMLEFEVYKVNLFIYLVPVAQLDRVFGYEPKGREFESLQARLLTIERSTPM